MFRSSKPYTAVTQTVNRLCGQAYELDDYDEIPELLETIYLQPSGATEAARAIRKTLKYGGAHQQMRALVILEILVSNGGKRLAPLYNDERLLDRLRAAACSSSTPTPVRRRMVSLFVGWHAELEGKRGYEGLVGLYKVLPKRAKTRVDPQAKSRRAAASAADSGEESADSASEDDEPSAGPSVAPVDTSRRDKDKDKDKDKQKKKKKSGKPVHRKIVISRPKIDMVKEKPKIQAVLAEAGTNSTNLLNSLQLLNREVDLSTDDAVATSWFDKCKKTRREVLRYIQIIEDEAYLGSLIHANEELVAALTKYDEMSRPKQEDDSLLGSEESDESEDEEDEDYDYEESLASDLASLQVEDSNDPFSDTHALR